MRLQLLHDYAGKLTRERRIQPDVYDSEDPRLMGLAEYLITNGHAVWVDDVAGVVSDDIHAFTGVEMVDFPVNVEPEVTDDDEHPVEDEIEHGGRKIKRRRS